MSNYRGTIPYLEGYNIKPIRALNSGEVTFTDGTNDFIKANQNNVRLMALNMIL